MHLILIFAAMLVASPVYATHPFDIVEILDVTPEADTQNPPLDVAVDASGNLFVTFAQPVNPDGSIDETVPRTNNVIRIAPGGAMTEIIDGTGDGTNALDFLLDVAVDTRGNVYVTGALSNNVFEITPNGTITEILDGCGDGIFDEKSEQCSEGSKLLSTPVGIAVDTNDNVYVTGSDSDNAFMITPGGTVTQLIGADGDGLNSLDGPLDIAVDASGNVFVSGSLSVNVFRITPMATITQIIDASGDDAGNLLGQPVDLTVDPAGNVFVAGRLTHNVLRITPTGTITEIIDTLGDGTNELNSPQGIAADDLGNVYVIGNQTDNAFIVTPAGAITQIIDATGDGMGAVLSRPRGIATTPDGDVFIAAADSANVFALPEPSLAMLRWVSVLAILGLRRHYHKLS